MAAGCMDQTRSEPEKYNVYVDFLRLFFYNKGISAYRREIPAAAVYKAV